MSMSKICIGGTIWQKFESDAPAAEEMLETVSYAAANSSVYRCAMKVVTVAVLFVIVCNVKPPYDDDDVDNKIIIGSEWVEFYILLDT